MLTDAGLDEAKRLDALCHAHGVKFIWAQSRGVFASIFNDFGSEFTVFDVDGECWGWRYGERKPPSVHTQKSSHTRAHAHTQHIFI